MLKCLSGCIKTSSQSDWIPTVYIAEMVMLRCFSTMCINYILIDAWNPDKIDKTQWVDKRHPVSR